MKKWIWRIVPACLALLLLCSCAKPAPAKDVMTPEEEARLYTDLVTVSEVELSDEAVAMAQEPLPAVPLSITATASGTLQEKNNKAVIDYSNASDGYVMVQYTAETTKRLKVQVKGPNITYTYNIPVGQWQTFSLSDGNGSYTVSVFENTTGSKYAKALSKSFNVTLKDEFMPFLLSNQYVNYDVAPNTIAKGLELTEGKEEALDKVAAVYDYVVSNFTYDYDLAKNVQSGYLPELDKVLEKKTGICFDYAAVMAAMLRSQSVPCKLVVGYAGKEYHAWISVYSQKDGWIDGAIFFDGSTWKRMDPTFASTGKQSQRIMSYISDDGNYVPKYLY